MHDTAKLCFSTILTTTLGMETVVHILSGSNERLMHDSDLQHFVLSLALGVSTLIQIVEEFLVLAPDDTPKQALDISMLIKMIVKLIDTPRLGCGSGMRSIALVFCTRIQFNCSPQDKFCC